MIDVSIIVVNYNTQQLTFNCIDSIFEKTTDVSFEVILIDNASTDGSVDVFSKDKRIVFIQSPQNIGFGKANNLGYSIAKGKYIFLLNSDTVLINNAVRIFYDSMQKLPTDVACLGTILKNEKMENIHSFGIFPRAFFNCFKKNIHLDYVGEVDYITGAALFIRKSVIEEFGFFDPAFFLYYEETELQYRYHKAGYKSVIIRDPQICHLHGKSSIFSSVKKEIMTKSFFIYHKKRLVCSSYLAFRCFFILKRLPMLLFERTSFKNKMNYFKILISKA